MWYIYTMEYYSAIKNNEFMKFLDKMDGSGGYHPKWGNPITKEHTWYSLSDKWILAQKLRIPKIQFTKHMKLKKKEDQSVDTSILVRRGNKIPMEEVTETKFRAETEGMPIQRLSHLGIHPYTTTKPRNYCGCQQELADRSLI
jgi:predicted DNA binding CopG/RHH family protein